MLLADDFNIASFCNKTGGLLQYVGYVLTIIKIAVPILIIAFGIMDLAKAVVNSKEDETKKAATRLIWRLVAGIAIFFLPSLVMWIFGTISSFNRATNDGTAFQNCKNCILTPWSGCEHTSEY